MDRFWSLWARAFGNEVSEDKKEADLIAIFRTLWVFFQVLQVVTCFCIIANMIRHW